MASSSLKLVRRVIKENREWLIDRTPVAENAIACLNENLGERTLHGLALATISLGVLGVYYGRLGQIRVIDGDSAGWDDLHKAIAYYFWKLKISWHYFVKTEFLRNVQTVLDLTSETSDAACLHCHHLTIGDESKQAFTLRVLRDMATFPGMVSERFWKRRVFEPFVLRLHAKQESIDLPDDIEQRDIGPYAKVLEHWDTPDRLAIAIKDICDLHCLRMFDRSNYWGSEFLSSPFDLIPCEVLAIYAVRRRLGLPVVNVDHPLLATPLASLGGDTKRGTDEVLRYVEHVWLMWSEG